MNKLFILLICILLVGCNTTPQEVQQGEFDTNKISYFKDNRTNLCFAVISYLRIDAAARMAGGLSQSSVPCTPEVESLIRIKP